jgi:hypothetical protein
MTEERKKVAPTRGLRQLEALLKGRKQTEFGKEVGIPQSALSEILNCWRLPTLEQAVRLQEKGIEPPAWTQPADEEGNAAPAAE